MNRGSGETAAYIATVDEDHRVTVPGAIPTGARVAIVVLPQTKGSHDTMSMDEPTRQAHFAAVMEAIRSVSEKAAPADAYSDEELAAIIERARKATSS